MSFPNVYAHRKVAETARRGCDVCFRPTSSVLLSEGADTKDFFFVCPAHLKDAKFCTAIVDQGAEERKKKAMDEEVERVRREYEERKKKAAEKGEKKGEEEGKADEKKDDGKDKDQSKVEEGEGKSKEEDPKGDSSSTPDEEHRFFALQRIFFNQRISKKREADMAKRNRERLQQPGLFPSVPKHLPGS